MAYSAAKSAYVGMVRALATEWGAHGVRVNAIAPGWIASDMLDQALRGDPARKAKILGRTPMGKFGEPDDIGWAAVYLLARRQICHGRGLAGGRRRGDWILRKYQPQRTQRAQRFLEMVSGLALRSCVFFAVKTRYEKTSPAPHRQSLDVHGASVEGPGMVAGAKVARDQGSRVRRRVLGRQPGIARRRRNDYGLIFIGGMSSGKAAEFPRLLQEQKDAGRSACQCAAGRRRHVDARSSGPGAGADREEGRKLGLEPAIEMHRDTCTETPEKTYALADAYQKATGELLPISWDFSHFAVVKHLVPGQFRRADDRAS